MAADAIIVSMPALVKSQIMSDGRRIVEVEASCERVDLDGDVILQNALLASADSFVANGHLDIDHLSELGHRLGIANPTSYIVGRPLEVKQLSGGRTSVVGEISKSRDGSFDPRVNKFDELWASLQQDPPVKWMASVYGFPTSVDDCTMGKCAKGATRYLVRGFDWRSLAFTRSPKNTALQEPTRIISVKSFVADYLAKSGVVGSGAYALSDDLPPSVNYADMEDMWAKRDCAKCDISQGPSTVGYQAHFEKCCGCTPGIAGIYAHAMMHRHNIAKVSGYFRLTS